MIDALLYIVKMIVDDKKAVSVDEAVEDDTINFAITVSKNDIGRVIGKEGKIIRSIRNVMKIPAIKQNKRINITINEVSS